VGPLLLFLTTLIWGTAFLAQKIGGDSLGPFAITCFRNILGGCFLLVCVLIRNYHKRGQSPKRGTDPSATGTVPSIKAGILCGVALFVAMVAQQIGIQYTTPGICAFLTTNYVLFVPMIVAVFTRRLPRPAVLACVAASLVGTYLICIARSDADGFSGVGRGELWTIACAFLFAVQMLLVNHYAPKTDVLVLSCTQLFTGAVLGAPFLLMPSESARLGHVAASLLPLVYLGVFSSGIAYTLQNFGQAKTPPAVAAVILSLESVFGALSGYLVLGDVMTVRQFAGCALVFAAAVAAQFADRAH